MSLTMDVTVYDLGLPAVRAENPVLFQKDISVIPRLSQFDVINPGKYTGQILM